MTGDIPLIDSSGRLCPLPVLRLRKAMAGQAKGALIRTRTTDPLALIDVPHFCAEAGHRIVDQTSEGAATVFTIEHG